MGRSKRMWGLAAMTAAATAMSATGCGGSDSGSDGSSSSASKTPSTTSTEIRKALTPEDNAKARQFLVQVTDLPSGWTEDNRKSKDNSKLSTTCPTLDFSKLTAVGRANGKDIQDSGGGEVTSMAAILKSPDEANAAQEKIDADETLRCITSVFAKELKDSIDKSDGVKVGDITVGRMSFPSLGDRTTAMRIRVPVEGNGISAEFNFDLVTIREGAALAYLLFLKNELGGGLSTSDQEGIAQLTASRMLKATGGSVGEPKFTIDGTSAEAFAPDRPTARMWCRQVEAGRYDDQLSNADAVNIRVAGSSRFDTEICVP